jgi:rRNA maturation endonuclease Nob1
MGLFENLGRKVEAFKQEVEGASEATASRQCIDCEELVYSDRTDCPACGGATVELEADE